MVISLLQLLLLKIIMYLGQSELAPPKEGAVKFAVLLKSGIRFCM